MHSQFHTKIAGVTAFNDTGGVRRSRQIIIKRFVEIDQPLLLIRERQNTFDKNAIAVYVRPAEDPWHEGKYQIGYLSREVAAELAPLIDQGYGATCKVADVTGGEEGKEAIGVNIFMTVYTPQEVIERRRQRDQLKGGAIKSQTTKLKPQSSFDWKEFSIYILNGVKNGTTKLWNSGKAGKISIGCGTFFIITLICGFLGSLFPSTLSDDEKLKTAEQGTLVAFVTQLVQTNEALTPVPPIETTMTMEDLSATPVAQEAPAAIEPTAEIPIPDNPEMACIPRNTKRETGIVNLVVDGDTIHVLINNIEYPLRYIGMDTPENTYEKQYYGVESFEYNRQLVEGKTVILVNDVSELDSFDRLLRYVIVDNLFVNYELVKNSFAYAKSYPPDSACDQTFAEAQNLAASLGSGIWIPQPTAVPTQAPIQEYIQEPTQVIAVNSCPNGCTTQLPGCDIKGNINSEGEKIYHTLSSSSYSRTEIDISKGELWFCTEAEAVANGWRAPRN